MERSLAVLLPVHNAQSTLAATVQQVLEVVSELTRRFELVIIDDGSTDATSEVAQELTCSYPQVRFVRHGRALGPEAAMAAGLEHSAADWVLLRAPSCGLPPEEIRRLWQRATEARPGGPSGSYPRWSVGTSGGPGPAARAPAPQSDHESGYQLLQRGHFAPCRRTHPARPNYLTRPREPAAEPSAAEPLL